MLTEKRTNELQQFATQIRIETVKQITTRGFGHIGGAMSVCDLLAALYGEIMTIDPARPDWDERDWFICSKGHAGPAVYAALALKGYFDVAELETLNQHGTQLPSHCDRLKTPGIDVTTGSLGQGLSVGIGVSLGHRLNANPAYTYVVLGDGESEEGQVWEAAMYAAQRKVNHLIAFIDYNKQQIDGFVKDVNDLGDLKAKFAEFGWYALEVDGSSIAEIAAAVAQGKAQTEKPTMIILHTKKGAGCYFAEDTLNNHHIEVSAEEGQEAVRQLTEKLIELQQVGGEKA